MGVVAAGAGAAGPWGAGITAGVASALAVRLVGPRRWRTGLGPLAAGAVVGWSVASSIPAGGWLAAAAALGCLTHLLGDLVTPEGVPLLWPLRRRIALPLLRSGGPGESLVTTVFSALILWRAYQLFEPAVRGAVG